uniref:DUF834 domain-containing protein n=1 Tax=Oryza punctata TaxID=4537 RepID=A0A0E0LUH3_ORYPU
MVVTPSPSLRSSRAEVETRVIMVVLPDIVVVVLTLTVAASGHEGRADTGRRESRRGEGVPRGMGGGMQRRRRWRRPVMRALEGTFLVGQAGVPRGVGGGMRTVSVAEVWVVVGGDAS